MIWSRPPQFQPTSPAGTGFETRSLTRLPGQVTAVPEVRCLQLAPGDEFLLLACDGIWDVLSNQEVRARRSLRPQPPADA